MASIAPPRVVTESAGARDATVAESALVRFQAARAATAEACRTLTAEDQMVQSCAEASPAKWHQAHTSWFFETFVLQPYMADYKAFHPDFGWLFNSYYKSLGNEIPEKKLRASFSRPSLAQILDFRAHVNRHVEQLLQHAEVPDEAVRRVVLGIQHEQQHLELLLADIKHAFYTNPLHPVYRESSIERSEVGSASHWIDMEGGLQEVGYTPRPDDLLDFAFDNELPRHTVFLQPYALANREVTCGEYLSFMNDNGYTRAELWLSEGWATAERERWQAPLYWSRCSDDATGWRTFTMGGWRGLSEMLETPVCHVSLFEADAYALWRGCRLPTEAEWELAAAHASVSGALLEDGRLHPVATEGDGLTQMFGNCWEWTASAYTGYPGYAALPGALGEYNGKFMSSQMVLRGGSAVTPVSHLRASYRNFFTPTTRWQFSGIRLARKFNTQ